jgi:hypothetical protein
MIGKLSVQEQTYQAVLAVLADGRSGGGGGGRLSPDEREHDHCAALTVELQSI